MRGKELVTTLMTRMLTRLRRAVTSERGASLVEYALLVGLIAIVCVVALAFLGDSASQSFSSSGELVGAA